MLAIISFLHRMDALLEDLCSLFVVRPSGWVCVVSFYKIFLLARLCLIAPLLYFLAFRFYHVVENTDLCYRYWCQGNSAGVWAYQYICLFVLKYED